MTIERNQHLTNFIIHKKTGRYHNFYNKFTLYSSLEAIIIFPLVHRSFIKLDYTVI